MRRIHRVLVLVSLLAVGPVLAGCSNFDPDSLDVFGLNEKKKLPGERKELFPGGVPGVTQGIPPEYQKGYQPPPDVAPTAEGAAATQTATAEEEKPKAKPKPKPRVAARPTRLNVGVPASQQAPAQQPQQQQAAPEPQQQQPAAQSPWPAPTQQSNSAPWPSSPPAGTFSKQ